MELLQHTEYKNIISEAQSSLEQLILPTRKSEDWRYTRISAFKPEKYTKAISNDVSQDVVQAGLIVGLDSFKVVFIDGVFREELSNLPGKDKLIVMPFSQVLENDEYKTFFYEKFNTISDKEDYFSLLNTASGAKGVFVYVPKNIVEEKPIELLYINSQQEKESSIAVRGLFIVEDNAQVTLTSRVYTLSTQSTVTNMLTEIFVGNNANMKLYKLQNDILESNLIDNTYVEQGRDSEASVHTFSLGGNVTRNNLVFNQQGENANSILKGISLITKDQEVGNHTLVLHNQPNCESHELYKGIYQESSHGIFNGKIKVDQEAQKINAFQQNNSILLSDKAEIDAKPQLEIFADDVKCSHGCTVGQLDNDALFYMKQRGIHEKEAQALLMFAFCSEVMESVSIPELQEEVNKAIAIKLNVAIDFDL